MSSQLDEPSLGEHVPNDGKDELADGAVAGGVPAPDVASLSLDCDSFHIFRQ